ncbi:hypothetical protein [Mucilaginibacter terrae]|uniref:Glycosyltransferase family 1 protein n=1 Tax=Mucilaginibacter terrae TaxID=1955052 RepID=A0ABU3GWW4_9SPHI|nr:hypothetical protein [Mucilaginibacter terrae]MDT3403492.1 hypothetical protein [Mucilaginibacter terrae]
MKRIVHITPTLPPVINGLGDFSYLVSQSIGELYEAEQFFLVVNKPPGNIDDNVSEFNAGNLYNKLIDARPDAVILHFVGYAYQIKGLPFYMPKALQKLKKETNCKVLVYFHELYATSNNILSTAFYTSYLQKAIVKQLYAVANQTFTNCVLYKGILSAALNGKPNTVIVTGLCSNIPEAYYNTHIAKEASSMVIFGSQTSRSAIYGNPFFNRVIKDSGIKTIYDIGAGSMNYYSPDVDFRPLGKLAAEDIAPYLNKSAYGAYDYAPHIIGKSGILSAYAAFSVVPINFSAIKEKVLDGLVPEKEYFDTASALPVHDMNTACTGLQNWYKQRTQKSIASTIIQHL